MRPEKRWKGVTVEDVHSRLLALEAEVIHYRRIFNSFAVKLAKLEGWRPNPKAIGKAVSDERERGLRRKMGLRRPRKK